MSWLLTPEQLDSVQQARRATQEKKAFARLSSLVMLDSGFTHADVALALDLHAETVGQWKQKYLAVGLEAYLRDEFAGSSAYLSDAQQAALTAHVLATPATTARAVGAWIAAAFHVAYGLSSVRALLRRLDFVNVRQQRVPGRADASAQAAFVAEFTRRTAEAAAQPAPQRQVFYFADAVHPRHQAQSTRVWIKRGTQASAALLPTNTGRQRLNLNGVVKASDPTQMLVQQADTINAQDTIRLFERLLAAEPTAERVVVICDNARYYRYYRCHLVADWLAAPPRLEQWFLPPYAPNLNLMERRWGCLHQQVLAGRYYAAFADFRAAVLGFFDPASLARQAAELRSLLAPNFHLIQSPLLTT